MVLEYFFCFGIASLKELENSSQAFLFTARSDCAFIDYTLPPLLSMCKRGECSVSVVIDTRKATGVLGNSLRQSKISELNQKIEALQKQSHFNIIETAYNTKRIKQANKLQFGHGFSETHCFRGYPIYGSFKQFLETDSKYVLHLDSDMIFYEANGFSWIKEGVRIMEENPDILCVLPKGGPPTNDGSLNQGTTSYQTDKNRGLYLFKNFTSRHYLIHRERFLSLLPLKPLWLSWREPIKSRGFGNGKMLCWETMVENVLENSNMWRGDLMTDQAWSLHPGDRSELFLSLLPSIIKKVQIGLYPPTQAGYFDLMVEAWDSFLRTKKRFIFCN